MSEFLSLKRGEVYILELNGVIFPFPIRRDTADQKVVDWVRAHSINKTK